MTIARLARRSGRGDVSSIRLLGLVVVGPPPRCPCWRTYRQTSLRSRFSSPPLALKLLYRLCFFSRDLIGWCQYTRTEAEEEAGGAPYLEDGAHRLQDHRAPRGRPACTPRTCSPTRRRAARSWCTKVR
ncbi:hypothetical protein FOCC_FOCC014949 [Frankliniella occidentalis]|nr:hypothetical protein FOCC_FOCC014949 [Frankliniella occidentalis]